ncbi:MAG: DUF4190 domain-containing protein [Planctomycetota bacterium]|jgi:hypothetical protein
MNDLESNDKDARNTMPADSQPASEKHGAEIRTSRLAVAASTLGILSLATFGLTALPAFILGVISLVRIEMSGGRLTGRGPAAVGITIPIVVLCLVMLMLPRVRGVSYRLHCGVNLSGIGKAMLVYSNDYDGELPRAGGPDSTWGQTSNFQAGTAAEAYGLNDGEGQASISANFYLLVKYGDVTPKSFLCRRDEKTTEFDLAEYEVRSKELIDLWDFGADPSKHCSYSYHMPYGPFALTSYSSPDMAVAADRNPWLPSRGVKAGEFESFDPDGDKEAIRAGNTHFHKGDGQNVLYVDGHTRFEKTSACGPDGDNIYTSQKGEDIARGVLPSMTSPPANSTDSLLLHDPPRETGETKRPGLILTGVTVTIAAIAAVTLILLKIRRKERQE